MAKRKGKRGPKEERLNIDGDWESAVNKALKKDKPKDGWPKKGEKKD